MKKDQQTLVKVIHKHGGDWMEKIPVITGSRDGIVNAGNGKIWVRFENGVEARVLNTVAALAFDRHILIGRLRSSPNVWRVAEIRESYLESSGNTVIAHHTQHEYGGFDMVSLSRKQIISASMFVADAALFKVRVYGGLFPKPGGWVFVASTNGTTVYPDIDLSSYVPDEGALYVNIEADSSGALVVNDGAPAESRELLDYSYVPVVPAGNRLIGFVMLYESQAQLSNSDIYLPGLFMTDYAVVDSGYQINTAAADTPLNADKFGFWDVVDGVLKSITWTNFKTLLNTLYSQVGHTHTTTTRWEPLTNGDPGDPQIVFDGEGDVIMIEVPI